MGNTSKIGATMKPKYKIGDIVTINATIEIHRDHDGYDEYLKPIGPLKRKIERTEIPPTKMFIIGARYRKLGIIHKSRSIYSLDGIEDEPGYLETTETVFVYQARINLMRKTIEVLPDDISK